jgi:hypothetical protein
MRPAAFHVMLLRFAAAVLIAIACAFDAAGQSSADIAVVVHPATT